MLQSSGIYRHATPRELVAHWAGFYPAPRDVDEVIDLAGLRECQDVLTRRLSGGQSRRLDFALALVGDPELVFLDEPTTGFDPAARRAAWDTIRALADLGKTVLLTTHYLDEAQALCDRVAIVKDGRILAVGAPAQLGVGASSRYRVAWRDESGELVSRETDDPTALLHQLTSAALARGTGLADLSVSRPSLEDVYLELTAEAAADRSSRSRRRRAGVAMSAALALTWRQYRLERKMFWRNPSAAFFNFVLPLLFLALFGAIFSGSQDDLDVIVPGIAGMSIMTTTFVALAMNLVFLREQGVLKRLRGTPLPSGNYLAALAGARRHEHGDPADDRHRRGRAALRRRPAAGLAHARDLRRGRRHLPGLARRRAVARDPELRLRAGLRQRDLPAGHRRSAASSTTPRTRPTFLRDIAQALPLTHLIDGLSAAMVTGARVRRPPRRPRGRAALGRARDRAGGARVQLGGAAGLSLVGRSLGRGSRLVQVAAARPCERTASIDAGARRADGRGLRSLRSRGNVATSARPRRSGRAGRRSPPRQTASAAGRDAHAISHPARQDCSAYGERGWIRPARQNREGGTVRDAHCDTDAGASGRRMPGAASRPEGRASSSTRSSPAGARQGRKGVRPTLSRPRTNAGGACPVTVTGTAGSAPASHSARSSPKTTTSSVRSPWR